MHVKKKSAGTFGILAVAPDSQAHVVTGCQVRLIANLSMPATALSTVAQDLASGAVQEAPAQSGAVAAACVTVDNAGFGGVAAATGGSSGAGGGAAGVAVAHAAALLADEAAVADALALRCLDWLLDAAPDRVLSVLVVRSCAGLAGWQLLCGWVCVGVRFAGSAVLPLTACQMQPASCGA